MRPLQVTLVAMVNNILSINHTELVTVRSPLCFYIYLFLYLPVTVATLSMTQPVFLQLVSMEKNKPFHPSPFLSVSVSLTLYCTSLVGSCSIVHEHFTVIAVHVFGVGYGDSHLERYFCLDDGVFLLLLLFSLIF